MLVNFLAETVENNTRTETTMFSSSDNETKLKNDRKVGFREMTDVFDVIFAAGFRFSRFFSKNCK